MAERHPSNDGLTCADSPHLPPPTQCCRHRHYDCYEEKSAAGILSTTSSSPPFVPSTTRSYPDHLTDTVPKPQPAYFSPYRRTSSTAQSSPETASTETVNECCAPVCARPSGTPKKMGFSKTQRICILLGIDVVFFLIELVVGQCPAGLSSRRIIH